MYEAAMCSNASVMFFLTMKASANFSNRAAVSASVTVVSKTQGFGAFRPRWRATNLWGFSATPAGMPTTASGVKNNEIKVNARIFGQLGS